MSRHGHISPDGRRRLREAALRNRPWESSTGPTSIEGKARSAQNSRKHGLTAQLRYLAEVRVDIARWLSALDVDAAHQEILQTLHHQHRTT